MFIHLWFLKRELFVLMKVLHQTQISSQKNPLGFFLFVEMWGGVFRQVKRYIVKGRDSGSTLLSFNWSWAHLWTWICERNIFFQGFCFSFCVAVRYNIANVSLFTLFMFRMESHLELSLRMEHYSIWPTPPTQHCYYICFQP